MPSPSLVFYTTSDVVMTTNVNLSGSSGSPSTAFAFRVYNDKDGANSSDPSEEYYLRILGRATDSDPWGLEGLEWQDRGFVEARVVSGLGGLTLAQGPWTPVPGEDPFPLPVMASTEGVQLELRINAVGGVDTITGELKLGVERLKSHVVAGAGDGGVGIDLGHLDATRSSIVYGGAVVENPGGADDSVQVGTVRWLGRGQHYAKLEHFITLSATDGDSATLATGESYIAALTLASDGTITTTKGSKDAQPMTEADRPALPAGEPLLAYVERPESATITSSEITAGEGEEHFSATSSGLVLTVAKGRAVLRKRLVRRELSQNATLTASSTQRVWLTRTGDLELTSGRTPPTDTDAIPLWKTTTDGTSVTELVDLRGYIPQNGRQLMWRESGSVNVGSLGNELAVGSGAWQVDPVEPCLITVGTAGGSAGATVADIEYYDGSSWVSIFTSQTATVPNEGPELPYDQLLASAGTPEVTELIGPLRLRARVAQVPSTGGAPDDVAVMLNLWRC